MIDTRLKKISLLLLDVDGVLTSGQVIYDDAGKETKVFNVRDGLGLRMLMEAGVTVGIITGRRSMALVHRCQNLGIVLLRDGVRDKGVRCGLKPWVLPTDLPDAGIERIGGVHCASRLLTSSISACFSASSA